MRLTIRVFALKIFGSIFLGLAGLTVLVVILNDEGSVLRLSGFVPSKPQVEVRMKVKSVADDEQVDLEAIIETRRPAIEYVNRAGAYEYFDEEGVNKEAADAYREFSVIPFNPLVHYCEDDWVKNSVGITFQKKCRAERKYQEHPFYQEELLSLVSRAEHEKDSLAAAIAAERLAESNMPRAIGLSIYASLVSGKPGPIYDAAQRHFSIDDVGDPLERSLRMPNYYALMKVAHEMGHPLVDMSFVYEIPESVRQEWDETVAKTRSQLELELLIEGFSPRN